MSMLTNAGEKEILVTWNRRKTPLNCKNSLSKVHNKHHIGRKGIPYVHMKVLHTYEVITYMWKHYIHMKTFHRCEDIAYTWRHYIHAMALHKCEAITFMWQHHLQVAALKGKKDACHSLILPILLEALLIQYENKFLIQHKEDKKKPSPKVGENICKIYISHRYIFYLTLLSFWD